MQFLKVKVDKVLSTYSNNYVAVNRKMLSAAAHSLHTKFVQLLVNLKCFFTHKTSQKNFHFSFEIKIPYNCQKGKEQKKKNIRKCMKKMFNINVNYE